MSQHDPSGETPSSQTAGHSAAMAGTGASLDEAVQAADQSDDGLAGASGTQSEGWSPEAASPVESGSGAPARQESESGSRVAVAGSAVAGSAVAGSALAEPYDPAAHETAARRPEMVEPAAVEPEATVAPAEPPAPSPTAARDSETRELDAEDAATEDSAAEEAAEDSPAPAPSVSEPMHWYVLKVQSNRERTIRDSLYRRIKRDGLEPYFGEIVIPTEQRVETKGGKKRVFEQKLYPGYIMIQMVLNDETWYLVRDTSGVGDFTGAAGKPPMPMLESEVNSMLARQKHEEEPKRIKISFAPGDTVKIKEGPFESFEGSINSVDEASGKVSVLIEIFGRSTPVDLEYWQVERV